MNNTKRKKNKAKHAAWEAMTTDQLKSLLGKRGRAKAIRAILRKRAQVEMLLNPVSVQDTLTFEPRRYAQLSLYKA